MFRSTSRLLTAAALVTVLFGGLWSLRVQARQGVAVAPPAFPVIPTTKNMRILPVLNGLYSRVGLI